jgi:hypothetical protein
MLDLIRNAGRWNNFEGDRIAADLEANRLLWRAAYFTVGSAKLFPELRPYNIEHRFNLLPLRQLSEGYLSCDTLFLLPQVNAHDQLEKLAAGWNAEALSWWSLDFVARAMMVSKKHHDHLFPDKSRGVLYVWWD